MKEIEVKILEIDVKKIRTWLKNNKAKFVKKVFQQNQFYKNKYTIKNNVIVRVRTEKFNSSTGSNTDLSNGSRNTPKIYSSKEQKSILTIKSNKKIIRNHKVFDEYELISNYDNITKMLHAMGLKLWGITEIKREYWKIYDCSVEICKLPNIPEYIEIEGSEKNISKVATGLGYSSKDFMPKNILKHYNIHEKDGLSVRFK
jgi:adenylate cyclase class IV